MAEPLKQALLPPGFGSTRGSEHEVWLSKAGDRVIKATHAGEFGRKFGPERFASLEEYLERVRLAVAEFGVDWEIEGVFGQDRSMRIVSNQPAFSGKPPTAKEIHRFLRDRKFVLHHTRFGDAWYRQEDGLLISDAEPKNAVLTVAGIMPFDFLIARPASELLTLAGIC